LFNQTKHLRPTGTSLSKEHFDSCHDSCLAASCAPMNCCSNHGPISWRAVLTDSTLSKHVCRQISHNGLNPIIHSRVVWHIVVIVSALRLFRHVLPPTIVGYRGATMIVTPTATWSSLPSVSSSDRSSTLRLSRSPHTFSNGFNLLQKRLWEIPFHRSL
jgi:hypothetical protein